MIGAYAAASDRPKAQMADAASWRFLQSSGSGRLTPSVRPALRPSQEAALRRSQETGGAVVQRQKCACGGEAGPDGECAACKAKREAQEAGAVGAGPATSLESESDAEGADMINGVRVSHALDCYHTGGESVCNPTTGNYDITKNSNTCCTKPCTQQHEQRHVTDLGGCCKKLADKIKAGGDANALIDQYNTWFDGGASNWSECNAYGVSVSCAENMKTTQKCGTGSGAASQCCTEIDDYLTLAKAQKTNKCAAAPATLPACPF